MNYYTADLHFGHKNIIKYENRPWSNTKEMDQGLIENWNKRVRSKDLVYILGDFTLSVNKDYILSILEQLKGRKVLITGNHDYFSQKSIFKKYFELIIPYLKIHEGRERLILCHYPIYSWDGKFNNTVHLYGHVHSNPAYQLRAQNAFNVGVDVRNYQPVTLKEILNEG